MVYGCNREGRELFMSRGICLRFLWHIFVINGHVKKDINRITILVLANEGQMTKVAKSNDYATSMTGGCCMGRGLTPPKSHCLSKDEGKFDHHQLII